MRKVPSPLELEIGAEKAAALGRSGRRLQAALERLRSFDSGAVRRPHGKASEEARAELVAKAGEAYWSYIVQREALGVFHNESVVEDFAIPPEVARRMGPRLPDPVRSRKTVRGRKP